MIKNIRKDIEENELTVRVECNLRKFATHPIKLLTTEELLDILKEEHNIVDVVSAPRHRVGNSNRQKIKTSGTWVFKMTKPTKNTSTKKPATKAKTRSPARKKTSIRGRMSAISGKNSEKREEVDKK